MTSDLESVLKELEKRVRERKLYNYRPYGHPDTLEPDGKLWIEKKWEHWSNKPWQLDFHAAGETHQQRMQMSANRVGKTEEAAAEVAIHMTGEYPDWWDGKVFKDPVLVWTGSPTNETSRDIVQKALLGGTDKENLGTGFIPKDKIIGRPKTRQAGVSDVVDLFKVRHASGGVSTCIMKTYEQGWRKWQGTEPEIVWMDEEPEDNEQQGRIYTEALTRLLTSHGIMMVTFTPLLGQTKLVRHFQKGGPGVWLANSTWFDAPHLNFEERERLAASYPDHERQAREMGIPMMGEGGIFTTPEKDIVCPPFEIPAFFSRISGIDFGIDHPFACSTLAIDRDKDIIYAVDSYKKEGEVPLIHSAKIKSFGDMPVAWPHDGTTRDKASGVELRDVYRKHGVRMLGKSARYKNEKGGSQPQWPVIEEIKERERTGRFKVFSTNHAYLEERRNYHTKDGKIVAVRDDTLKATFYAVMMKRYASTGITKTTQHMPAAMRF